MTWGAKGPVPSVAGRVVKTDAAGVLEKVAVPADVGKVEALEVTVRPEIVPTSGSLLLQIELFDQSELAKRGSEAAAIARGIVSFFPAAKVGVSKAFVIPIPSEQRARATAGGALSVACSSRRDALPLLEAPPVTAATRCSSDCA